MESEIDRDARLQPIKDHIFVQPATKKVRPYLVEYVFTLIAAAKELSQGRLLGSEGHNIAMDITGALAWQSATGVENDGWFNEKDEPVLLAMFAVAGILDTDPNHPQKWRELFKLAEKLEQEKRLA